MDQPIQPGSPRRVTPLISAVAAHVSALSWERLSGAVRHRAPLVVLDLLGCAMAGRRLGAHDAWVQSMVAVGGAEQSTVWGTDARLPAAHAALVNGAVAHHVEMDDGNPRASVHGAVTVIPATLAAAELAGADGRAVLEAIVAGYDAAVACGRPVVRGMTAHRLHEPSMVGCLGAAAGAARVAGAATPIIGASLSLAAISMPLGPFEAFTRGAPVKDLYAGWPAFVGVTSAALARAGLAGPVDVFESPADGVGSFLLHAPVDEVERPDPAELLHVQFKAYATCRSVQPALTALEQLLPIDLETVESIVVDTYPFAVELSRDSDCTTPIGAKTSVPYAVASCLLDGEVGPASFTAAAVAQAQRQAMARRVTVRVAADMVDPIVRGARVEIRLSTGERRRARVRSTRWTDAAPATEEELREKFRRLSGPAGAAIERAVDDLIDAPNLSALLAALRASN